MINIHPTFIDLFAGAGGLSEGFVQNGFVPIAHVEMDKDACLTLKTRIAYHHLKKNNQSSAYLSYLKNEISRDELYEKIPQNLIGSVLNATISQETLPSLFSQIDSLRATRRIDVIIGGPPCQAYSTLRRFSDKKTKQELDSRKLLYKYYVEFLEKYNPKIFLFENVPGLISSDNGKYLKDMLKAFEELDYNVGYEKLNASDFGVVQNRQRIIIIGSKKNINFTYPAFARNEIQKSVGYVLADLPRLSPGECQDIAFYTAMSNAYLRKTGIRNDSEFTTQHIARPHNPNDRKIYKKAILLWKNHRERLKYTDLPQSLQMHKNKDAFLDRFKVVASDLEASHTLVAHIAKDGHYYIHPDEDQLRSLSVREAARIQSFPDDYYFEGTRTSAFKQIGNAVPPLMAGIIALKIKDLLNEKNIKSV